MIVSFNWLKDYIDIPESPQEIADTLTKTGLEVEHISPHYSIEGGLSGLVVGEVLTCVKHPNADKLFLTTVEVGLERPLQIVCGAPNVAVGQKVVVAKPETTIHPTKKEPFKIISTKIRNELSEGMICAEDEIGLGKNHSEIIVLNNNVKAGTLVSEYFDVKSDFCLEIGLTPNRSDATSHIGVARDIGAVKKRSLRWPSIEKFKVDKITHNYKVEIENSDGCIRYSAVAISNITVRESPDWLKIRLKSIGIDPINNIVDATNFVCHEIGQPLHAFDGDKIAGNKIIVKTLPKGTLFTTLDNKKRVLSENDLMICSESEGLCMAGVFGGINSGVSSNTRTIFLESACFSPSFIRKTEKLHQLNTDASFRFSRGTDPTITLYALKRATLLIKELAGGLISSEVIDYQSKPTERADILIKHKNVNRLIGQIIPKETVFDILKRLDFEIEEQSEGSFKVLAPQYRVDVVQEADVIEEILRIYGFDNIEPATMIKANYLTSLPQTKVNKFNRSVSALLASNGFLEISTNSLTNENYHNKNSLHFDNQVVRVINPLSSEHEILRQTLLFTGLEVCEYNFNRQQKDFKFFEFGKVYGKIENKWVETPKLCLFISGQEEPENWDTASKTVSYHNLVQTVSQIFEKSQVTEYSQKKIDTPPFQYGSTYYLKGQPIAQLGLIKTEILKSFSIKQPVFFAELNLSLLVNSSNRDFTIQTISKYPEVRRDISMVLSNKVNYEDIEKSVKDSGIKKIKKISLFDMYVSESIEKGKKVYGVSFIIQDEKKTMTDIEINEIMITLQNIFETKLNATIRQLTS